MKYYVPVILFAILFAACKPAVKPQDLYGKWKYTRVQSPDGSPSDSVTQMTLLENKPYIEFTTKDSLLIYWGGQVLSHGTFTTNGRDIQVKEIMADGKTRDFPFFVTDITDKQIIFTTKGKGRSEVTAVKE